MNSKNSKEPYDHDTSFGITMYWALLTFIGLVSMGCTAGFIHAALTGRL